MGKCAVFITPSQTSVRKSKTDEEVKNIDLLLVYCFQRFPRIRTAIYNAL